MNEQVYRIEYDEKRVVGLIPNDENSVTYSSNKFIVDTLSSGKIMLSALNIDCMLIDIQTGEFIHETNG